MSTVPDDDHQSHVVHDRLVALVDELALHDSRIRRHEHGGVHGMRVTLRRMRSLLATFGPMYDEPTVAALREELRWVATELAGARDAQVVRHRVRLLSTTAEERALAHTITADLRNVEDDGVRSSVASMDSERYAGVLREVRSFVTDAPRAGDEPDGDEVQRRRVRRDWKRLRRRAQAAETAEPADRPAALHQVRKAAKRLRYAAETLVPSHGSDASRLARRAKRVQKDLGEAQDSAVAQEVLQRLADGPGRTTREVFLLGTFHEREREDARRAEQRYAESWSRLNRKKNRRWLA